MSDTYLYEDIYKYIAEIYNDIVISPHNNQEYIKDLFFYINNLTEANYIDSINISIIFMQSWNDLYSSFSSYNYYDYNLVPSVRVINTYFKSKIDTSLTDFVNSVWEDEVPSNWTYLCQLSGEDISNWNS